MNYPCLNNGADGKSPKPPRPWIVHHYTTITVKTRTDILQLYIYDEIKFIDDQLLLYHHSMGPTLRTLYEHFFDMPIFQTADAWMVYE